MSRGSNVQKQYWLVSSLELYGDCVSSSKLYFQNVNIGLLITGAFR